MFERNRIAETLRSAREQRGLSLEQASAEAGVPMQYVRLLEGEPNVKVGISDELYLIPFFRKYAQYVGVDAEGLLPEFLGMVQQMPGEGSPPIRLAYRPRYASLWKPVAVLLTIVIAATLLLRQTSGRPPIEDSVPNESSTSVASVAVVDASATPVVDATPAATVTPATTTSAYATGAAGTSPVATPATGSAVTGAHELVIAAKEDAWLALALDDQQAKQYLLRAGESRTWSAGRFSLTVGNAGGVTLTVDGTELPAIGRPGKVVRNLRLPIEAPVPSPSPP